MVASVVFAFLQQFEASSVFLLHIGFQKGSVQWWDPDFRPGWSKDLNPGFKMKTWKNPRLLYWWRDPDRLVACLSAWTRCLGPAGGDKRPRLWPSSAPDWGVLWALILFCQPLSTSAHYTTYWFTSAPKWDNTFVECEITTMHCGNITRGLRKEEDCSLEKSCVGCFLPALRTRGEFLFSAKRKVARW